MPQERQWPSGRADVSEPGGPGFDSSSRQPQVVFTFTVLLYSDSLPIFWMDPDKGKNKVPVTDTESVFSKQLIIFVYHRNEMASLDELKQGKQIVY